jgi:hypothetical protein
MTIHVADNRMVPTAIVPLRPGPLREPGPPPVTDPPARIFGAPEIGLAATGAVLLIAVAAIGLPFWLLIPAVGCLGMGLALPVQAMLSRGRMAGTGRVGVPIDVGHESAERLVAAYRRIAAAQGHRDTLVTAHRVLMEVADHLDGRPPSGPGDVGFVTRRADAMAVLADRL